MTPRPSHRVKFDIRLSDVLALDTVMTTTATPRTSGTSTTTATPGPLRISMTAIAMSTATPGPLRISMTATATSTATPGLSHISMTTTATSTATPGPSGISTIPIVTSTTYTMTHALVTTTSTTAASQEVSINVPIRGPLRGFPVAMIENLPSTSNILQSSHIALLRNFEMTLISSDNPPYCENPGLHTNEFWQRLFINWHLNMNSRAVETSCFVSYYYVNLVSQFRKFSFTIP